MHTRQLPTAENGSPSTTTSNLRPSPALASGTSKSRTNAFVLTRPPASLQMRAGETPTAQHPNTRTCNTLLLGRPSTPPIAPLQCLTLQNVNNIFFYNQLRQNLPVSHRISTGKTILLSPSPPLSHTLGLVLGSSPSPPHLGLLACCCCVKNTPLPLF